jgi:hypothetical protein
VPIHSIHLPFEHKFANTPSPFQNTWASPYPSPFNTHMPIPPPSPFNTHGNPQFQHACAITSSYNTIHRLKLEQLNPENDYLNGLNPQWDWSPNRPNPEWTEPQMDSTWIVSTPSVLNPKCTQPWMDSTLNRLNLLWLKYYCILFLNPFFIYIYIPWLMYKEKITILYPFFSWFVYCITVCIIKGWSRNCAIRGSEELEVESLSGLSPFGVEFLSG